MYRAEILDKNRKLVAILTGCRWRSAGGLNASGRIEIQIPRTVVNKAIPNGHTLHDFFNTQDKLSYAEIAAFVRVKKLDKALCTGKITGRNVVGDVKITALTEESLLESNQTPAQYGAVWEGWDLSDVARDILDGWSALRVKDQSEWQQRIVSSSNVDLTTEPGVVMLAKRSNGRYFDSGHIVLKFDKSEIMYFKHWDRVRWSADSDGTNPKDGAEIVVQTTIQTSTNGTSYSQAFDGGDPEEVGYVVTGDSDSVWVRINLITRDTESEDPEGNPAGVTPVVYACEMIARTHGELTGEGIPEVAGVTVSGISANDASTLAVIGQACEQTGFEFAVKDGVLNVAKKLGVDRTKDFIFRKSTNCDITNLGDDDRELVNILTAYGQGSGINRLKITLHDWDSIAEYGEYPKSQEFSVTSLAELEQKAQEHLEDHSKPQVAFEISAVYPHGKEPEFEKGDTVLVADPDTGIVSETRIMHESRDYTDQGLAISLELGKASLTPAQVIGRDGKDGKDGKDGRDGRPGKDGKDGTIDVPIPANPMWGTYHLTDRLYLSWHKAEFASGYEIRDNLNWGSASGQIFRGYAHEFGFIPVEREMILYLRAFNVNGEYSEGYATLNLSLPAPSAPNQPLVREFFKALKIDVEPLNEPSVRGYYAYITADGTTEKVQMFAGSPLTYAMESGVTATIQISAFDVIGEGAKSEPLQATTKYIDEDDLPDEVVKARHMVAGVIDTLLINAELAVMDEADVLKMRVDKMTVGGTRHSGIPITKPKDGKLWHFDTSLHSTCGIKPLDGAVATLRPNEGRFGGAVAVEEATVNLVDNGGFEDGLSGWTSLGSDEIYLVEGYKGNGLRLINYSTGSIVPRQSITLNLDAGTVLTGQVKMKTNDPSDLSGMQMRTTQSGVPDLPVMLDKTIDLGNGWKQYFFQTTVPDTVSGSGVFGLYPLPADFECIIDEIQLEAKPFATSFVDGSRPDGILAYPIALPEDYSIACYRKSHTDEDYKHVVKRSDGTVFVDGVEDSECDVGWIAGRNLVLNSATEHTFTDTIFNKPLRADVFHKMIGEQLSLSFYAKAETAGQMMDWYLRDVSAASIVSGSQRGPIEISTEYTRYSYTIVLSDISDVNNLSFAFRNTSSAGGSVRDAVSVKNIKIEKGSTATHWTPAPEDLGYDGDTLMLSNQTGLIDELLVLDYEATDEEIKAWYELNQPFYDANEVLAYQGKGGYIEIGQSGQRFIRYADSKTMIAFGTETGDAYFAGRAEFVGDKGKILINPEDGLKFIRNSDNRTLIDLNAQTGMADFTGRFRVMREDSSNLLAELQAGDIGGRLDIYRNDGRKMLALGALDSSLYNSGGVQIYDPTGDDGDNIFWVSGARESGLLRRYTSQMSLIATHRHTSGLHATAGAFRCDLFGSEVILGEGDSSGNFTKGLRLGINQGDLRCSFHKDDRSWWFGCVSSSYVGDGEPEQRLPLPFDASLVFVITIPKSIIPGVGNRLYSWFVTESGTFSVNGSSKNEGCYIDNSVHELVVASATQGWEHDTNLNRKDQRYFYVAFR